MIAESIERELSQAKREKQALLKTLAELDARIERQEQAAVNLQNLYDYCRKVERELATFGFAEQRLAIEALGVVVRANGREWRMNVRLPHVVESTTVSLNCLRNLIRVTLAYHPPDRPTRRANAS